MTTSYALDALAGSGKNYEHFVEYLRDPDTPGPVLSPKRFSQALHIDLWALVKPAVRAVEADDGVLICDDTVEEKPHSDENEIIAWHFDHCVNRLGQGRQHPQLPV